MNLRKYARVTVDGVRVALTVVHCPTCESGTAVWKPVGWQSRGYFLGHLSQVRRRDRRSFLVISGKCPGDVFPSHEHGVVVKGPHRMGLMLRGLRMLGMD